MWHFAQTLICLCCLLSGPATAPAPKPVAALRLYSSAFEVKQGSPLETVIEITNTGDGVVKVQDMVLMKRIVQVPPGLIALEAKEEDFVPEGTLQLRVLCEVPAHSQKKLMNAFQTLVYSVPPGKSQLMKVTVPTIAFEPGRCALSAESLDKSVRSQRIEIQCVGRPDR